MDAKLRQYTSFIAAEVRKIASTKDESSEYRRELKNLTDYHKNMVEIFQHERLVHLIVTLSFSVMFVALFILNITLPSLLSNANSSTATIIQSSLVVVLTIIFVTTLFYLRHYYRLENGTQKLYKYTEKLYRLSGQSSH